MSPNYQPNWERELTRARREAYEAALFERERKRIAERAQRDGEALEAYFRELDEKRRGVGLAPYRPRPSSMTANTNTTHEPSPPPKSKRKVKPKPTFAQATEMYLTTGKIADKDAMLAAYAREHPDGELFDAQAAVAKDVAKAMQPGPAEPANSKVPRAPRTSLGELSLPAKAGLLLVWIAAWMFLIWTLSTTL